MLSQFSREGDHQTLADLDFQFAKDIYPVGRLDADSEGLLLLTNDNFLKTKLLEPRNRHTRTYYVQVEGTATKHVSSFQAGLPFRLMVNNIKHCLPKFR
jgi:23S rRNA pseudouridine2457 synthase